jgi:hypothetical protein
MTQGIDLMADDVVVVKRGVINPLFKRTAFKADNYITVLDSSSPIGFSVPVCANTPGLSDLEWVQDSDLQWTPDSDSSKS